MKRDGPTDVFGRRLHDLRISVTDRCNFRCGYCMPADRDYEFLDRDALLDFDEIERLARIFVELGARKIRITGGEPLLRQGLEELVGRLARLEGVEDLAMTTNGFLLAGRARALGEAGLDRVTVSLDALDPETFGRMNGRGFGLERVLEGVEAALAEDLRPLKINMVVRKGVNDDRVLEMARRFRGTDVVVRFIEYMDVGTLNGWRLEDVVPSRDLVERIGRELPLVPIGRSRPGQVAERWRYMDGSGEIGFVSSVSEPFCGACTRARLSADGRLYTCLFASRGHDLRAPMREGVDDAGIRGIVESVWSGRTDHYSETRTAQTDGLELPASALLRLARSDGGTHRSGPAGGAGEGDPAEGKGAPGREERVEMFRIGG